MLSTAHRHLFVSLDHGILNILHNQIGWRMLFQHSPFRRSWWTWALTSLHEARGEETCLTLLTQASHAYLTTKSIFMLHPHHPLELVLLWTHFAKILILLQFPAPSYTRACTHARALSLSRVKRTAKQTSFSTSACSFRDRLSSCRHKNLIPIPTGTTHRDTQAPLICRKTFIFIDTRIYYANQGLTTFFLKGPDSQYFRLVAIWSSSQPLCPSGMKAARDNIETSEYGCVSAKFYLWILKSEFDSIFTCHKILLFFWFIFNHLKM